MRGNTEIADRIDEQLGEYRNLERRLSSILNGSGLSIEAWRVLRLVQREAQVTMKVVLESTGLPPASATRAVDLLVSLDYVYRFQAEFDRRSVQVLPSPSGYDALTEIDAALALKFADSLND